jgi:hypothetical protein
MVGAIVGVDGIIVFAIALVGLVIPLWAIVDALSRPSGAFKAAGSSKGMWVALILVFWLLTGLIGVVLAVVYLAAIRPRVRAVTPGF